MKLLLKTLPIGLASLALAASLAADAPAVQSLSTTEPKPCCVKPLDTGAISDDSLYQLTSTWTNDFGLPVKLINFKGKPQVVTMFFARCVSACPILVHDMRKIEAALPPDVREEVGFILVTFDTVNDTPEALANYRKAHKLPKNWTLLTATPDDVLELAALLGIKFKKESTGQFAHSNVITLLDADGRIHLQQSGLNRDPAPLAMGLKSLSAAR